jgi:hypothetical protein
MAGLAGRFGCYIEASRKDGKPSGSSNPSSPAKNTCRDAHSGLLVRGIKSTGSNFMRPCHQSPSKSMENWA